MKTSKILVIIVALISLSIPACDKNEDQQEPEQQKIVVTSPMAKDVVITRPYVCQIHSRQHIEVCALANGYIQDIGIKEGQHVNKGYVMFRILPVLYEAKRDAEMAEAKLAELELNFTKGLSRDKVVSPNEVQLYKAKLARARAKAQLASAELKFTEVTAPFDGIVDRQQRQLGSLIKEGEVLTTLSDNSVMWVYFNVPEKQYLEYKRGKDRGDSQTIELVLADGTKFPYPGKIAAIEAKFNNETGNIPFRADFKNPEGLLRHGQTGTVRIHRTVKNALVIPQRATFEILDKQYVYVVDKENVVHQRLIVVKHELEDEFVIEKYEKTKKGEMGLDVNDRIVLEGVRQVHDAGEVEGYEFRKPADALANQKNHAE